MIREVKRTKCGSSRMFAFVDRNQLGEKIVVQVCRTKTDVGVGRDNHPKYWLSVTTLVTDRQGNTREKYNPQIKIRNNQKTVDRAWILEPNMENTQRLLEQVERLAFGGQ